MSEVPRRGVGLVLCVVFVLIMLLGVDRSAVPDTAATSRASWRIDLANASSKELELLPGIGPVLANRIVAWRQDNENLDALVNLSHIRGIGPHTIRTLRPLVSVAASSSPGEFKNED